MYFFGVIGILEPVVPWQSFHLDISGKTCIETQPFLGKSHNFFKANVHEILDFNQKQYTE